MSPRIAAASLALAALPSWAAVATVEYVQPEKFSDVGRDYARAERDAYLDALRLHLVEQAARLLPADQKLAVSITDLDMAGDFEPRPGRQNEVRIVKDIYPPRIELRFRLEGADGALVKEGERRLRDSAFLMTSNRFSADPLRFEKALLDRWLRDEFAPARR